METGFIWKGIHSSEKGLKIISLPNISTPEKREDKIIVDGRDGYLTIDNNSYEGEVKTVEFDIKHNNFDDIKSWLSGSGEVIFSNEPDRYYNSSLINKVDLVRVLEKFHSGIIQFDCQPFGYLLNETPITWTKGLLEGLGGDTYDLNKIHPSFRPNVVVETINNKKWLKFLYNPATSTPALVLNQITLKPNTTYTYSFNVYTTGTDNSIRCYNNDGNAYNHKDYAISKSSIRINHTFTTRENTTYDTLHIVDLNKDEAYYFSDFKLVEGDMTSLNNQNLMIGSYDYDTIYWKNKGTPELTDEIYKGSKVVRISQPWSNKAYDLSWLTWLDETKIYTFSFYVKADYDTSSYKDYFLTLYGSAPSAKQVTTLNNVSKEWKQFSVQINKLDKVGGGANGLRVESAVATPVGKYLYFCGFKLQEGTKVTPWTPSPLDNVLLINNKGTRESKPTITIYGTGDINLYINKETVKLKNVEDKITINTEMMEAYKDTMPCNNKMYGEFPVLNIGSNNIAWTGNVTKIEVQPNTVFL